VCKRLVAAAALVAAGAVQAHTPLLAGGDVSALSWMESAGAHCAHCAYCAHCAHCAHCVNFVHDADREGKRGDALQLLKRYEDDIVRIRPDEQISRGTSADAWPGQLTDNGAHPASMNPPQNPARLHGRVTAHPAQDVARAACPVLGPDHDRRAQRGLGASGGRGQG